MLNMDCRHSVAVMALLLLPLTLCGCGGETDDTVRYHISGSVVFDGQPITVGNITFMPDDNKGNSGPSGYTKIVDGKFDTKTGGKGHIGGPHTVRIEGFDGNADLENDIPYGTALFPDFIFAKDLPKSESSDSFTVEKAAD